MMNRTGMKSKRIVPCFVTAIVPAIIARLNLLWWRQNTTTKPGGWKRKVSGTNLILSTQTSATKIHLTGALAIHQDLHSNHQRLEPLPHLVVCQEITLATHVVASSENTTTRSIATRKSTLRSDGKPESKESHEER